MGTHLPGDFASTYTSPWAGANWWPVSRADTREAEWDTQTFRELWRLANTVPAAGIAVRECHIYKRNKDAGGIITDWIDSLLSDEPWFRELAPGFRKLEKAELPKGVDSGTTFSSVCINPAIFLPYVLGECLQLGATVRRGTLRHIAEAAGMHAEGKADVVVNCTGLMAGKLGGVMDEKVIPARGQIVVVRNEAPTMMTISGTDDGPEESTYIMMRPNGNPSHPAHPCRVGS